MATYIAGGARAQINTMGPNPDPWKLQKFLSGAVINVWNVLRDDVHVLVETGSPEAAKGVQAILANADWVDEALVIGEREVVAFFK